MWWHLEKPCCKNLIMSRIVKQGTNHRKSYGHYRTIDDMIFGWWVVKRSRSCYNCRIHFISNQSKFVWINWDSTQIIWSFVEIFQKMFLFCDSPMFRCFQYSSEKVFFIVSSIQWIKVRSCWKNFKNSSWRHTFWDTLG